MNWQDFYFDAIERLGLTPEDAEWHADRMMDQLTRPVDSTGHTENVNEHR